jgi:serine/threonine-protein kinase
MTPFDSSEASVLGPYVLRGVRGRGTIGVVYEAIDLRDESRVAVKVLRRELAQSPLFARRFRREVEIASTLRDRSLVPVLDAGESHGVLFLVTEFAPQGSLADRLLFGPLVLEDVVKLTSSVGRGLDALASAGLVHRDVKPANLLLFGSSVRLTDFGLARGPAHTALTRPGQLVGSVAYAAPELVEGGKATAASDIYALACVVFECLAARPPFVGKVIEVACAHVEREPPDVVAERPELPALVGEVVRSGLAKDPAARPVSGHMLAQLLHLASRG